MNPTRSTLWSSIIGLLRDLTRSTPHNIASTIEESLELRGIRPYYTAKEIVAKARAQAGLNAPDAMALAVEETRRFRDEESR